MSLRKRSGKWHYRFKFKGQEYTGSTDLAATPQNKGEASENETNARRRLKSGKRPANEIEVISFRNAVPKFGIWAKSKYRAHPNSCRRIMTSLSSAVVFFDKLPVSAIDAATIDDYKIWRAEEHEVVDVTIRHDLHALSTFCQYAVRHHWAYSNPVEEVDIPSDADAERIHVLTVVEEEDYFRRAARLPDLHDVGRLMINQGMRPEEVTTLAKDNINFESGTIYVARGKTKAAKRHLNMTTESRQILDRRMAGQSKWIFPSKRKGGAHIYRINSAHDRIIAEAAKDGVLIEFVPYDFRHTFATRAVAEDKVDLATLAALLGHGSIRCVYKYVHPTDEHKRAAMKRIDRRMKRSNNKSNRRGKR